MDLVVFAKKNPDLLQIFEGERFVFFTASAFESAAEIQCTTLYGSMVKYDGLSWFFYLNMPRNANIILNNWMVTTTVSADNFWQVSCKLLINS